MRPWIVATMFLSGCGVIHVPEIAKQYNGQCVDALNGGDLAQADVLCDHALSFQEQYWDALNNKGLIALRRGETQQAKTFFIRAIRANQDMAQAYSNLCRMALDVADFTAARDRCLAALRINPDFAEARHNLGLAYLRSNRLDDAEKSFRHLVVSAPTLSSGYASVGAVMLLKRRPAEAMPWFDQALQLRVADPAVWKGKAWAFEQLGRHDEALEAFSECLSYDRSDLECRQGIERLAGAE